jgi:hypothetical protein
MLVLRLLRLQLRIFEASDAAVGYCRKGLQPLEAK